MKHFQLSEFARSATADALDIPNRIPAALVPNIEALADNVLDPLREAYGKPVTVTSGYRSPALNKAVKGSATSDHKLGRAADIVGTPATRTENQKLFNLIKQLGLPFDQLINEKDFSWIHVSYRSEAENRKEVLGM